MKAETEEKGPLQIQALRPLNFHINFYFMTLELKERKGVVITFRGRTPLWFVIGVRGCPGHGFLLGRLSSVKDISKLPLCGL